MLLFVITWRIHWLHQTSSGSLSLSVYVPVDRLGRVYCSAMWGSTGRTVRSKQLCEGSYNIKTIRVATLLAN